MFWDYFITYKMNRLKQTILIKRIRNQDTEAFREVYQIFADKIYRYIFFRIPSQEQAEDLLQDVFLKFWNYLAGEDVKVDNLQALLYRLAKTSIAGYYLTQGQQKNIAERDKVDLDEMEWQLESKDDIEHEIDIKMRVKQVHQQLDTLGNEEYKEVIELRYLQGLSHKEIAEVMNKSENNIRVLFHRALKKLKENLTEDEDDSNKSN